MKYFIDTEFIEDGHTIDLISIGIVSEDDREFYAISKEFNPEKANTWVQENVLVHLPPRPVNFLSDEVGAPWMSRWGIMSGLLQFVGDDPQIEFWGYYADYDWVVLCQLFGAMIALPKTWPMYCRDIKQWCDQLGNPKLPESTDIEHHALADARWNRTAWEYLKSMPTDRRKITSAVAAIDDMNEKRGGILNATQQIRNILD